jgi:spermidine synthase
LIWYFIFFFISGFCSVLYELVWLRLSMAQFGVTTAMVSIVLSVFMAGLGLGSWASGRWLRQRTEARQFPALRVYALTELLIGGSAILVPHELAWGRSVLEHIALSSLGYYVVAGLWVALSLLPWCALMGATVPIGMQAIRQTISRESGRSFSYLYTANVAGAVVGTVVPLFLIELLGFRGTLKIGTACNCLIAVSAFALSKFAGSVAREANNPEDSKQSAQPAAAHNVSSGNQRILGLLFLSGLTSMAMEVVWVRSYTPYYGTVVYSFASILGVYLLATYLGSVVYRRWSARHTLESPILWSLLGSLALLPLIGANPAIHLARIPRLVLGVMPFTGLLGFITPMLVDRFSAGNPDRAGKAYAVNVAGCILGPLIAGFGLLPFVSERWALVVLALPWLVVGLAPLRPSLKPSFARRLAVMGSLALAVDLIVVGKGYEESYSDGRILRDYTATVIAAGTDMDKALLVNGYGMTSLTPITKVMAHLPLAFLDRPPQNALVICFGMGTTFRSLRSWGIPVTAAELVPSVPRMFDYYHADGLQVLASPLSHVVIDDGRRFLERTREEFDVITIDPPPPVQAAGSSLLYSEEFYQAARKRLRPGGILQQWLPSDFADPQTVTAVARAAYDSFPYVRAFQDEFGFHLLCSDQPIPARSALELIQRMPASAVADFAEWDNSANGANAAAYARFTALLVNEIPMDRLLAAAPNAPALSDDHPVNEYYAVRRWLHHQKSPQEDSSPLEEDSQ